ncbi:hypothetical protein PG993_000102 [Apiospora rasikravindrae]|uniref:GH18 domain-containing protein n=1 Tax=Apiospora rasikravindrae TaxID=990691 RepID=A0ABR1U9U8_9PEZI
MEPWAALGGWSFNDTDEPTATAYSDLARSDIAHLNIFFSSLAVFMLTYRFTVVDIDWQYPTAADRNGRPEDFKTLPKLLSNLRSSLNGYYTNLLLLRDCGCAAEELPVDP